MHKDDADRRGIVDGDMVRVFNQRGSLQIPAQVVDRVRQQVVAMSHGWWASRMPGGSSANALTPDGLSDLGGGGDFHDARVQVKKLRV
jgi:anaerobic selenocysteine-containing dehydrogenase